MGKPIDNLEKLQALGPNNFEILRQTRLRPGYDYTGLENLHLKAIRERDLRELYKDRAPYELIQNADDVGATRAIFVLDREGAAFLHDGEWFTVDQFKSLAEGWSDKDPSVCIGHKGLGFRSVLQVTPAPHLFRVQHQGFFGVKFAYALNNGHIQETLSKHPEFRPDYEKWTRYGQSACPVMAIPGLARRQSIGSASRILEEASQGTYGPDLTTAFWLPSADPDIDRAVQADLAPIPIVADPSGRERLSRFLSDEVAVLLPFLRHIVDVGVYEGNSCIGRVALPNSNKSRDGRLTVLYTGSEQHRACFFQVRTSKPIPTEIRNRPDTPKALKQLKEATLVLSVRLDQDQPVPDADARFHVYFPTKERTGVGFTVHSDFYVMPDRTRLMESSYNDWLLNFAAQTAAGVFLTRLLDEFHDSAVFAALGPTAMYAPEMAQKLLGSFSEALQSRKEPFIPTVTGHARRNDVVLPPTVDDDGFWQGHFGEALASQEKPKSLLLSSEDSESTRRFLKLANVEVMSAAAFLDLVESESKSRPCPSWWLECYQYMERDAELSRREPADFEGRKLLPVADRDIGVIEVQGAEGKIVVLPPKVGIHVIIPVCFTQSFVFLDLDLARLLWEAPDTLRNWVTGHLHVSSFEATDLLPRAISAAAPGMYAGKTPLSLTEIASVWRFVKDVVGSGRAIHDPEFWQALGRLPLPKQGCPHEGLLDPLNLAPSFLLYWPDSWLAEAACVRGITAIPRVDEHFLDLLVRSKSSGSRSDWQEFFEQIDVSRYPRIRSYRRVLAEKQLVLAPDALDDVAHERFTGRRQVDENFAVVRVLASEDSWTPLLRETQQCGHNAQAVTNSLALIEGLSAVVRKAIDEYQSQDPRWKLRLWDLLRHLPDTSVRVSDQAFCAGGGGHYLEMGNYLASQLDQYAWVPTSRGPAPRKSSFLRMSSRRLIQAGATGEELGDLVLPYVIAETADDVSRLQTLGVEPLDDAGSATTECLTRFLTAIGETLSTEWGQAEILRSRPRWRLVRGAIQEVYRALNRSGENFNCPSELTCAMRNADQISFQRLPAYYADPGSPVEEAFAGKLPLFDSDRAHPRLFHCLAVTRLVPGETVDLRVQGLHAAVDADTLRNEILEDVAPYLLAVVISRSDNPKMEMTIRRLKQRLRVKAINAIQVHLALSADPSVAATVDYPKSYLHRELVQASGAVEEAHYTLYVAGSSEASILGGLDADNLGEALVGVFLDDESREITGLFPRVSSRYQAVGGEREAMEEFLLHQLSVSGEALDEARSRLTGELPKEPIVQPPPPIIAVATASLREGRDPDPSVSADELLRVHQDKLQQKGSEFLSSIRTPLGGTGENRGGSTDSQAPNGPPPNVAPAITPEQEIRGKRGEQEVKRRLQNPGGWEGFTLLADRRTDNCGYDFLLPG